MKHGVILFLVDGMRPDAITSSNTPTMARILATGAYTLHAKTVMPSVTLPCHTSLFFSVPPERHGIVTNTWTPMARPIPGLFDVLHQHGLRSASFYNWEPLRDLSSPGSLAFSLMASNLHEPEGRGDLELADCAIRWLTAHPWDFAFIYLGQTDEVAHRAGWMSDRYFESLHYADRAMSQVMEALPDDVTYFITSDHGGHDRNHGTELESDMTIPLLIQGAKVRPGELSGVTASITDIAPTIAARLGVPKPPDWDGRNLLTG
ncbi:MAG: alkaline phosphatase family protein [Anaerolineae bacterium]|nr:alkaline phosphatase family protein [Anaerolineae bacterium]